MTDRSGVEMSDKLIAVLGAARCPDNHCDNAGTTWYESRDCHGDPEQVPQQCQWCTYRTEAISALEAKPEPKCDCHLYEYQVCDICQGTGNDVAAKPLPDSVEDWIAGSASWYDTACEPELAIEACNVRAHLTQLHSQHQAELAKRDAEIADWKAGAAAEARLHDEARMEIAAAREQGRREALQAAPADKLERLLEMAGFTLTMMEQDDERRKYYLQCCQWIESIRGAQEGFEKTVADTYAAVTKERFESAMDTCALNLKTAEHQQK